MRRDITTKMYSTLLQRLQQLLIAAELLIRELWIRLGGRDRATDEAWEWVTRLDSCSDLGPMLPEFRQWLNARPANAERFGELWEFWDALGELTDRDAWRRVNPAHEPIGEEADRKVLRWRWVLGIACVTLAVGLYLTRDSLFSCTPSAESTATQCLIGGHHASSAGETVSLRLFDGSTVTLSERSEVTVDLRNDRRQVRLDEGEARFRVAKKLNLQFEVFLEGETHIRAVGTDFLVRKTGHGGARVEVLEGAVDLLVGDQQAVQVKQGQMAEFDANVIRLTRENAVWFIFHSEPLTDAVREFNRFNSRHKIFIDGDLSGRSVHGWFLATNPEGFAVMMASTWKMACLISRDATGMETIHLSRAGPHPSAPHHTRGRVTVEEQQ